MLRDMDMWWVVVVVCVCVCGRGSGWIACVVVCERGSGRNGVKKKIVWMGLGEVKR